MDNVSAWIGLGTSAAALLGVLVGLVRADRRQAKLELIEKAAQVLILLKNEDDKKEIRQLIRFVSKGLGSVWWRSGFGIIGLFAIGLAFAILGAAVALSGPVPVSDPGLGDYVEMSLFCLAVKTAGIGVVMEGVAWFHYQHTKGA